MPGGLRGNIGHAHHQWCRARATIAMSALARQIAGRGMKQGTPPSSRTNPD